MGAASEIGTAVTRRFQAEGAVVVGVDVEEHGVGDESLTADFRDEGAVADAFAHVADRYERIDAVYNNVGRMDPADGSILDLDLATWRRQQDTNLTTVMLSCKHAVPHLRRNPSGGAIVNAASFLGTIGAATAPMAFSASKAAVIQLTRDLGVHLARSGVRVNSVSFGPIATEQQRRQLERTASILPARIAHWPTGRYGTLDEAAAAVVFLAGPDAGFLTAHDLELDGGITRAFTVPDP